MIIKYSIEVWSRIANEYLEICNSNEVEEMKEIFKHSYNDTPCRLIKTYYEVLDIKNAGETEESRIGDKRRITNEQRRNSSGK